MNEHRPSRLRFNFGFFLEATLGTSRTYELAYPSIWVADDLTLTPLKGAFTATRVSEGVYLSGKLETTHHIVCMRCLEEAVIPLRFALDDIFYYPLSAMPEGEYGIGENGFIDLAPLIRELAVLEIPIQPICKSDCKGLCVECGQNLNEADCGCEIDIVDPRLASLRQLLDS